MAQGDGFGTKWGPGGGGGTHRAPLRITLQSAEVLQELLGHSLQVGVAALGHGQDALQGQGAPELGGRLGEDFWLQDHRLDESQCMKTHFCVWVWGREGTLLVRMTLQEWRRSLSLNSSWPF